MFDAGVFLVVVGTTLTIIELLAQTDDAFVPVGDVSASEAEPAGKRRTLMELMLPLLAAVLIGTGVFLVLARGR